MAIKFYKPTTSGRRQMTTTDYSELSKVAPERSLLAPLKRIQDVTATVESLFATVAAATEENTAS